MSVGWVEDFLSWLIPLTTIGLVIAVQWSFWNTTSPTLTTGSDTSGLATPTREQVGANINENDTSTTTNSNPSTTALLHGEITISIRTKELANASSTKNHTVPTLLPPGFNANYCTVIASPQDGGNSDPSAETPVGFTCNCSSGWVPRGILSSLGSAEAMIRLGTGQCYHKQM
eukprot:Nitzschia sp. Nitz4//scaffold6_size259037//212549//213067//NITZ4_001113-RA/size259037-processed-gene-0.222-mRNA-1//1//CDS//3329557010//9463//frame0